MLFFSVLVLDGILHHGVKTSKQTCAEGRLCNDFSCGIVLDTAFHRTFQRNDRMSASLYFSIHFIGYGIHFKGKHELFGVVVGLAGKRNVLYAHFIRTPLNARTLCHDRKLFVHCINHRLDIILLKFDDGIKCGNRPVVVLSCSSDGFRVVYGFPIGHDIAHVALPTYHLPGIGKLAAHNLLQGHAAFLDDAYQLVGFNLGLAHGRPYGV